MKKLMFAFAAVVALMASTGTASAQVVSTGPTGGCATCAQGGAPEYAPSYGMPSGGGHFHNPTYGVHPGFSRLLAPHKNFIDKIAFPGGHGGKGGPGGGGSPYGNGLFGRGPGGDGGPTGPTMEAAQGGTLVFPQNPYIRSPRDFFMWEPK